MHKVAKQQSALALWGSSVGIKSSLLFIYSRFMSDMHVFTQFNKPPACDNVNTVTLDPQESCLNHEYDSYESVGIIIRFLYFHRNQMNCIRIACQPVNISSINTQKTAGPVGQMNSSDESIILMVQDFRKISLFRKRKFILYLFPFTNSMMIEADA